MCKAKYSWLSMLHKLKEEVGSVGFIILGPSLIFTDEISNANISHYFLSPLNKLMWSQTIFTALLASDIW